MASHTKSSSSRSFGALLGVAFLILAMWKFRSGALSYLLWASLSGAFLLLALLVPRLLRPVKNLWLHLGYLLGRVLSPIFLTIVYVFSVVPIGLLLKALRKDSLQLARDPKRDSYWIVREPPGPDPRSLKNQF
jgi:hypothetical protein